MGSLLGQLLFVHPTGDLQSLRVIGHGDESVTPVPRRFRHHRKRGRAVAVGGVHLQVGSQVRHPFRVLMEGNPGFGHGEETAPDRRRLRRLDRGIEQPAGDGSRQPRSDGWKLRQRTIGRG